ncbi:hypothetical protein U3653_25255 [Nocardia sp. CDC186]|uniref:Uncharacterized protein n=3 Tax=Nocardia implantans TaxID=3108168 RepID=A0ABU6B0R4_9NOCA|nr:hypothetical protein [Nocardia sp. CDC186]
MRSGDRPYGHPIATIAGEADAQQKQPVRVTVTLIGADRRVLIDLFRVHHRDPKGAQPTMSPSERTTDRVLAVWAPPEFVSDGSNGILSWAGPALRTPTGLRLSLTAEAVGEAAPSLQSYQPGVSALVNGVATDVGWGSSSSDTHAQTTFILPDLDPDTASVDIELTIDDITTDGPWVRRLSWPDDTVYSAPLGDPRGRLAMLTDPAFVTEDDGPIEAWIGPVTIDPNGIEFLYTATALDERAPSIWDYEVDAVLRTTFGTSAVVAGESTSATRTIRTFQAPIPEGIADTPWDFELLLTDHTAGVTWSTEFSWNGPTS